MALTVTSRGTGTHNTGATTLVPGGRTATLAVGSMGVLAIALDNAGSAGASLIAPATWTDAKGNVWTRQQNALFDNGAASAGIEMAFYTAPITVALLTGDAGTITWAGGASPVAKAWTWYEVIPSAGRTVEYSTGGTIAGATAANAQVVTASVPIGDAVIAGYFSENVNAVTGDADATNGSWTAQQTATIGSGTSGVRIATQQKVQTTAASTQSYDVTVASQDRIAGYILLHELATVSLALIDQTASPFAPTVTVGAVNVSVGLIDQTAVASSPLVERITAIGIDNFGRTVAVDSGWDVADLGGTWAHTNTNAMGVDGSVGYWNATGSNVNRLQRLPVSVLNVDVSFEFSMTSLPPGGTTAQFRATARHVAAGPDYYWAQALVSSSGDLSVGLGTQIGAISNTLTSVSLGAIFAANTRYKIRLQTDGSTPTDLRAKVWLATSAEPGSWDLTTSDDSSSTLQAASGVGVLFKTNGSITSTLRANEFLAKATGVQTAILARINQTAALFSPTVVSAAADISPALIDQTATTFAPTVATVGNGALVVVADKTAPTTIDARISGLVSAAGFTPTYVSDEDAVPSLTGVSVVVICESCASATLGTKYRDVAVPVIVLDNSVAINMELTVDNQTGAGQTQVVVQNSAYTDGLTGTQTTFSSGVALRYTTTSLLPAGGVSYLSTVASAAESVAGAYESGSLLDDGFTAQARRAFLYLFFETYTSASINSTSDALFTAILEWTTTPGVNVSVALIDQTAATFAPTATPGTVAISVGLINQAAATFAPTVTATRNLIIGLITQAAATFAPVISVGEVNVSLALIDRTAVVSAPTITTGAVTVAVALIDRTAVASAPTVTPGTATISVGVTNQTATTFAPTITTATTASVGLLNQTATTFAPVVSAAAADISLALLNQTAVASAPTITTGVVNISLGLIDRTAVASTPTVSASNAISIALTDRTAATFTPTITKLNTIAPALLDRTAVAHAPSISVGAAPVSVGIISQPAAAFAPTVTTTASISLALINRTAVASTPSVSRSVALATINQTAATFAPAVTALATIAPALLDRTAVALAPTVTSAASISLALLDRTATPFTPTIANRQLIDLGLINQTAIAYDPTVLSGGALIEVDTIDRTATPFTPAITTGGVTVSLGLINQTAATFAPAITASAAVVLVLTSQPAAAFTPTITTQSSIVLGRISQQAVTFNPAVTTGAASIVLGRITNTAQAFGPSISAPAGGQVFFDLINQAAVAHAPTVTGGAVSATPSPEGGGGAGRSSRTTFVVVQPGPRQFAGMRIIAQNAKAYEPKVEVDEEIVALGLDDESLLTIKW